MGDLVELFSDYRIVSRFEQAAKDKRQKERKLAKTKVAKDIKEAFVNNDSDNVIESIVVERRTNEDRRQARIQRGRFIDTRQGKDRRQQARPNVYVQA